MHGLQIIEKDRIIPNLLCESHITLIPKVDENNIKYKLYKNYMNIDVKILGAFSKLSAVR